MFVLVAILLLLSRIYLTLAAPSPEVSSTAEVSLTGNSVSADTKLASLPTATDPTPQADAGAYDKSDDTTADYLLTRSGMKMLAGKPNYYEEDMKIAENFGAGWAKIHVSFINIITTKRLL